MYEGYELALKQNRPVSFMFRDVETTLYPDQQEVDDCMIDIRIKDVLKQLNKSSNVSTFEWSYLLYFLSQTDRVPHIFLLFLRIPFFWQLFSFEPAFWHHFWPVFCVLPKC